MDKENVINWQIEDGYVGKCRPQKTKIDDNELLECESQEEAEKLIHSFVRNDFNIVRNDFNNRVYYCIDNMNELIEYWRNEREVKK